MNENNEPYHVVERAVEVAKVPDTTGRVKAVERVTYMRARERMSAGAIVALVVGVITIGLLIAFFFYSQQQSGQNQAEMMRQMQEREAAAARKPAPPPVIVQQPAPQQPVIIQQPAPQQPVIINQPAAQPASEPDDAAIQSNIDKRLTNDSALAPLGITATVTNGKVTLLGNVATPELKQRLERLVKEIKGVRGVDNQITVFNS